MLALTGFKYCPNCGSQSLQTKDTKFCLCTSCSFLYGHNAAAAVAGIIEHDGKVIVTVRAYEPQKGMLALPGGFVDYEESLEEALAREVQEEVNLKVEALDYLCSYWGKYFYRGVNYFTTIAHFVIHVKDMTKVKAGDDAERFLTLLLDDIDVNQFAFDCDKLALTKYQTYRKRSV